MRLNEKGHTPHILVMTATPIPRTLAVILFGDMDISLLDEKPAGRREIITKAFDDLHRPEVYRIVEQELKRGQQAFVVTPLIEESDTLDIKSAEEVFAQLEKEFATFKVACLHGDMPRKEKDSIMLDFSEGRIQLLVSTVVIEVGIDVPNASVMVVENAERFGLAQLHQLRGRVGRGDAQSYCLLISEGNSLYAKQRSDIMAASSDGFYIAEKDLELRGPGEFFGTRQHGLPELKLADLSRHIKILEEAKIQATKTLSHDPDLSGYPDLYEKAKVLFERGLNL
jgi:ATP-dependent DNA helicase RecG